MPGVDNTGCGWLPDMPMRTRHFAQIARVGDLLPRANRAQVNARICQQQRKWMPRLLKVTGEAVGP